jgi:hypothetical protein
MHAFCRFSAKREGLVQKDGDSMCFKITFFRALIHAHMPLGAKN